MSSLGTEELEKPKVFINRKLPKMGNKKKKSLDYKGQSHAQ